MSIFSGYQGENRTANKFTRNDQTSVSKSSHAFSFEASVSGRGRWIKWKIALILKKNSAQKSAISIISYI
ncbi:hypothetical protein A9996_08795 [Gelidibacter algens]|jgi:hypothetical protein|nr:hypothetical protein A9996_08795 [Gelidibacter algens]